MRESSKYFVLAKISTLAFSSALNFRGEIPPFGLKVQIRWKLIDVSQAIGKGLLPQSPGRKLHPPE